MGENSNKKELKRQKRMKKEEKRNTTRLYSHAKGVSCAAAAEFRHCPCGSLVGNKARLLQSHCTISLPNSLKGGPQAQL